MTDEERMTPEELMQEVIERATDDTHAVIVDLRQESTSPYSPYDSSIIQHGAAAIRRALADQRATIVAWLMVDIEAWEREASDRETSGNDRSMAFILREKASEQREIVNGLRSGEPESWATRAGFAPT